MLGRPFVIQTDHFSLKYLLEQRITTPMQQKWLYKLMGYEYEIQFKNRKEIGVADALSRISSPDMSIMAVSTVSSELMPKIVNSWHSDHDL